MSRVSGDFPVQLAARLPDWSAGDLLRCSAARVSCVVLFSNFHEPDTHDLLQTSSRECHEDTARMLRVNCFLPWNLSYSGVGME